MSDGSYPVLFSACVHIDCLFMCFSGFPRVLFLKADNVCRLLKSDPFSVTSQRYSLVAPSLLANRRWISAAPLGCDMPRSSQAAPPGLLWDRAAYPQP